MRVLTALLLVATLVACQGFTDPLGRQDALEDSQKRYTEFVRWGDLERASRYVEPESREQFLKRVPEFEHIRVTDFDVQDIEYEGEDEVNIVVTYHGFSLLHLVERRFREHQRWVRDPGIKNKWWLTTDLAQVLGEVEKRIVTAPQDSRPMRRRLLVVDDSPIFLELESTFLSRIGRVSTAGAAEEAMELAKRERPDVVIADLHMPDVPGDVLCRDLKSDPDLAHTPVILVTGRNHAEDHERAVRAGADDVVHKPIDRLQLIQAVNRFLKLAVRGLVRVSLEADVCVDQQGQQVWGRARNVSRGGMFIESELTPDPSSEIELDFKLPDSNRPIAPSAQVVWRRSARSGAAPGIGVRFLKLDPDASRRIDDFVYERADGIYDAPPPGPVMPER